jgi:hypothetical protein
LFENELPDGCRGFLGDGCPGRAVSDEGGGGKGRDVRGTAACIPFFPCLACDLETCSSVRPVAGFTPRAPSTSSIGFAKALSMLVGVPAPGWQRSGALSDFL